MLTKPRRLFLKAMIYTDPTWKKMGYHVTRGTKYIHSLKSPGNWNAIFRGNSFHFEERTAWEPAAFTVFQRLIFFKMVSAELLSSLKHAISLFPVFDTLRIRVAVIYLQLKKALCFLIFINFFLWAQYCAEQKRKMTNWTLKVFTVVL